MLLSPPKATPPSVEPPKIVQDELLKNGWILPVLSVLLIISMLVTVNLSAVLNSGFDLLPLLSEAATFSPQAALFGQFMTIISFTQLFTFLIRHKQVKCLLSERMLPIEADKTYILYLNRLATAFGVSHAFILPSSSIFRVTEYSHVHSLSALLAIITISLHVLVSVKLTRRLSNSCLESRPSTMMINGSLLTITFVVFLASVVVNRSEKTQYDLGLVRPFTKFHNFTSALEYLSFVGVCVHMICVANRMRKFSK